MQEMRKTGRGDQRAVQRDDPSRIRQNTDLHMHVRKPGALRKNDLEGQAGTAPALTRGQESCLSSPVRLKNS